MELGVEVGLEVDRVLYFALADFLDNGVHLRAREEGEKSATGAQQALPCHACSHLEGQVDIVRRAVPHQLKGAVRRREGNGSVAVVLVELDTLMELAVVQLDGSYGRRFVAQTSSVAITADAALLLAVEDELVVEAELALGPARVGVVWLSAASPMTPFKLLALTCPSSRRA